MKHINDDFIGWFTYPRLYKDMVELFPNGSTMVEVGVYEGKSFSYLIIEMLNADKMFNLACVDSFTFPGLYEKFKSNMAMLSGFFNIITAQSWDAANRYADNSVDFVFLDADHVYENIRKDIIAWMPKIKPGGILAGHDYTRVHPGVIKAVVEIFGDNFDKSYIDETCWLWQKQ